MATAEKIQLPPMSLHIKTEEQEVVEICTQQTPPTTNIIHTGVMEITPTLITNKSAMADASCQQIAPPLTYQRLTSTSHVMGHNQRHVLHSGVEQSGSQEMEQQPIVTPPPQPQKRPSTISLTSSKISSAKHVKPNLVKPQFEVKYAEHLIHIGNARYAVYGVVEGFSIIRIQECDYKYKVHDGEKQQTKMIRFTIQQWVDLIDKLEVVNDAIEEFDVVKLHLGRNTYLRVQPDRRRIDIREYFLPSDAKCGLDIAPNDFEPSLIPTRRGISLTYEEWRRFVFKGIPLINAGADELRAAVLRGSCISQHNAQKEMLLCNHCNPNGFTVW
jgi:hypothetical protein